YQKAIALHRPGRRSAGGDVHHVRSATLRNEHESGAHAGFGSLGRRLPVAMGLLHGPAAGDVPRGAGLPAMAWIASGLLRQAAPQQSSALHLPLPFCGTRERRMSMHYDVIIIGTGAGGGTLAWKLAPTGKNILILERGGF